MLNYQEFVIGSGGDYPDIDTFNAAFNNTFIPFPETTVVVCLVNEVHAWGQHITAPTNVRHLHVTVAGDNWHKGSKSIGCRIRADAHSSEYAALEISCISRSHTQFVTVEKLVIDANQQIGSSISLHGLNITSSINSSAYMQTAVDKCIFTAGGDVDCRGFLGIVANNRPICITNCLVYDATLTGTVGSQNVIAIGLDEYIWIHNNTLHNIGWANKSANTTEGIGLTNPHTLDYTGIIQGNIVTEIGDGETATCFNANAQAHPQFLLNVADDGTGNTSSTAAAEFVDPANGNFNLKAGAQAQALLPNRVQPASGWSDRNYKFLSFLEPWRDITGQIRAAGNWDAGCFNNLSGYASEPSTPGGGGGSVVTHPIRG